MAARSGWGCFGALDAPPLSLACEGERGRGGMSCHPDAFIYRGLGHKELGAVSGYVAQVSQVQQPEMFSLVKNSRFCN